MWPFSRVPTIDPANGDPRARALLAALEARDAATVWQIFTFAADANDQAFLMEVAVEAGGVQAWIGEWIAADPDQLLPVLIRGCHAVKWAWDARGDRYARFTRRSQLQEFFRRLEIAESCLQEVTRRDPDNVTAWTWLTMSARGRQVSQAEAAHRFSAITDRVPGHVIAHEQRLQYLCGKWFGSHDAMFAFARAATARAPHGSLLPELLVVAHLEYWLSLPPGKDKAYLTSAPVREEIVAAAERSILHPAFAPSFGWLRRANTFAMPLTIIGEYERAARVFDLIGNQPTEWPWIYQGYVGTSAAKFMTARREAYRHRNRASTSA